MTTDPSDVEDDIVTHAQSVALDFRFWSVPMPEGEALRFVHVYPHPAGHWHYVTDGLAALDLELTYRVPRTSDTPPAEPLDLLRRLSHSIAHDRQVPAAMHTIVVDPPIAPGSPLTAVAVVPDRELDDGGLAYLQCVGITANEAEACVRHSTEVVLDRLREADEWLVTVHEREEIHVADRPDLPVSEGRSVPTLRWELDAARELYVVWIEPARMRASFVEHLLRRVGRGAHLRVSGPQARLVFEPGASSQVERVGSAERPTLRLSLDASALAQVAAAREEPGALRVGRCELHFGDEPGETSAMGPSLQIGAPVELALPPHVAHRRARQAFDARRFDEVLALVPCAVRDGDHGLLAELLHIDTLRRMGRAEDARALFASTADEWLGGKRRQIWDTQWKKLAELGKALNLTMNDPRLARIAQRSGDAP